MIIKKRASTVLLCLHLFIVYGFSDFNLKNQISEEVEEKHVNNVILECQAKTIVKFIYYSICDGIKWILI